MSEPHQADALGPTAVRRVRTLADGRMTRTEAAHYIGVHPQTLRRWSREGTGPAPIKIGGRFHYFISDCDQFVASGRAA